MTRLAWDVTMWGLEVLTWLTYRAWHPEPLIRRRPPARHRKTA